MEHIKDFLKEKIEEWIKENPEKPFGLKDLLGADWRDTPLQSLYEKHLDNGEETDKTWSNARREAGMLLKEVVDTMENVEFFDSEHNDRGEKVNKYKKK